MWIPGVGIVDCYEYGDNAWKMEIAIEADINFYESVHPIQNAYYYGDSPFTIAKILDDKINSINKINLKEYLKSINLEETAFRPDVPYWLPRNVVERFLSVVGLDHKQYIIAMAKLTGYDITTDRKIIILRIKTCLYKLDTVHAKVVHLTAIVKMIDKARKQIKVNLIKADLSGVIHQSYLPLQMGPWENITDLR